MSLVRPSCQKSMFLAGLVLLAAPAGALRAQTGFSAADAVRAEWERQPPTLDGAALAALDPADRARLERTLWRIGAPGAPDLLPSWMHLPADLPVWEARARAARTPQERFTALAYLNRGKSALALTALDGLDAKDAAAWPAALHLEGPVAAARLNGAVPSAGGAAFLAKLQEAGKSDPVRVAAAQLRLVLAGLEKGETRLTDPSNLALLDAWNRGPWPVRAKEHLIMLTGALAAPFNAGPAQRLIEGLPAEMTPEMVPLIKTAMHSSWIPVKGAALEYVAKQPRLDPDLLVDLKRDAFRTYAGPLCGGYLAALRRHAPAEADRYGRFLTSVDDVQSLAAALEDLPQVPANLDALVLRLWKTSQYDAVASFLPALERWKLPEAQRKALLTRFLQHPCWTARLDAYRLLAKLDPATPWPSAPKPSFLEEPILAEALRLAVQAKPVRLRITFEGSRVVVLKLDPATAPINVANLVLLARRGFFDGHAVPRVVPDFVVQMGSPSDSMDGGPGYTVRCENSLDWYGPGSVGMALSGKDTGGSQFFITTNAAPHLTGQYTRVGELEDPGNALPMLDRLELGTRILKVEIL